jgi:multidrug efflux pump subunit AcrA (membrane-fusion protein)
MLPVEEETLPPPVIRAYESAVYTYATVGRGDLMTYVDISASEIPAHEEVLSFPISAVLIKEIHVGVGDEVKTGDLLAELDREAIESRIETTLHNIEKTQLQIRQTLEMHTLENKYAAGNTQAQQLQLNQLYTQLDIHNVDLERLREQSNERALFSPMDGTVTYVRKTEDGDVSREGERFITVTDKTVSLFTVSGPNAAYLKPGDELMLKMSGSDYFGGMVVDPAEAGVFSPRETSAYLTISEVPPDVRRSTYVTIRHTLETKEDVLYLPTQAIQSATDTEFVYVMEDNIRKMVTIETGMVASDGRTEITAGLAEGDSVILE